MVMVIATFGEQMIRRVIDQEFRPKGKSLRVENAAISALICAQHSFYKLDYIEVTYERNKTL
jgi:hypothetical protein